MRKRLSILLAMIMLTLVLTGCGANKSAPASTNATGNNTVATEGAIDPFVGKWFDADHSSDIFSIFSEVFGDGTYRNVIIVNDSNGYREETDGGTWRTLGNNMYELSFVLDGTPQTAIVVYGPADDEMYLDGESWGKRYSGEFMLMGASSNTPSASSSDQSISGLVAVYDYGKKAGRAYELNLEVVSINPSTGASNTVRRFYLNSNTVTSDYNPDRIVIDRHLFNTDYTLLGAKYLEGADRYAGWIDQNGNFTNVTEICFGRRGDFSSAYHYEVAGFDDYGYFYFYDWIDNNNFNYYRVPVDNVSPSTLESINPVIENSSHVDFSYKSNAVDSMLEFGDPNARHGYSSSYYETTDWIDSTRCLVNCYHASSGILSISLAIADGVTPEEAAAVPLYLGSPYSSPSSTTTFIPEISGRSNWNGVISPDGSSVAFLSKLTGESQTSLFIIPLSGGEPTKVNTDVVFTGIANEGAFIQGDSYMATLVEWR